MVDYTQPNITALAQAVAEAQRFLAAAKRAQASIESGNWKDGGKAVYLSGPANAAAKRASLDLSMALVRYRKA